MNNVIKIKGKIVFDPPNRTKKHTNQSAWKRVAYVLFDGDICEYYSWFIFKRYNLPLARPLRGPHVTFINDSERDIGDNISKWDDLKRKWDGKEVEVELDINTMSDSINWWFKLTESSRGVLHAIRAEIGLGRPYWGLHMTLGFASDCYDVNNENNNAIKAIRRNEDHSRYIYRAIMMARDKEDYYINEKGKVVFTEKFHLKRGFCCNNRCKHCPYEDEK